MPKRRLVILFNSLMICCFLVVFSNTSTAQTSFRRKSPDAVETESSGSQPEVQSEYDRRRAEREEQRRIREEERKLRAEQRTTRSLAGTSRDSRNQPSNNTGGEEVFDAEVASKRGEAFSLDSLGKNDNAVLSLGSIRDIMVGRLELLRNDRFSIGTVYEIDENNASAELLTSEGALVQYIVVDRKTGSMFFALPDYAPEKISYDPNSFASTKEEAEALLSKLVEYEQEIESRFGDMEKFIEYERLLEEEKEYLKTLEEYQPPKAEEAESNSNEG